MEYKYYHLWDHRNDILTLKEVSNNLKIFAAEEWEIAKKWNIDFRIFENKNVDIVFGTYETDFYKNIKNIPNNVNIHSWPNYWCMHTRYQLNKERQYPKQNDIVIPFITLNTQPHAHRCMLIDYLSREKLLEQGAVTWHFPNIEYNWKYWKPKHLFLDDDYIDTQNSYKKLPTQFYQSFVNVVAESTADIPFITEKTWIPIFLEKPFLIVGAKGIHKYLKTLGIEMYDEVFNYDFDDFETIEERIEGIIKNLHLLKNTDLNKINNTIKNKLKHNRNIAEKISWDDTLIPKVIKKHIKYINKSKNSDKLLGIDLLWKDINKRNKRNRGKIMGASAFDLILDYEDIITEGAIVEVGASRGDGSTHFFAGYTAHNPKFKFYSIDINPELTRHLTKFERVKHSNIKVLTGKGEDLISQINENISYAYLDNFDFIRAGLENDPVIQQQKLKYKNDYGIDMNNKNCNLAHLNQAKEIVKKASNKCIIQIDDTMLEDGKWIGKGATAVPWLLSVGWKLLPEHSDPWTNSDYVALANWL